jgi:hypothetical protein
MKFAQPRAGKIAELSMGEKRAIVSALVLVGVLVLVYPHRITNPARIKARTQHITGVNAAPRITMSFILSNTPAPTNASTGK